MKINTGKGIDYIYILIFIMLSFSTSIEFGAVINFGVVVNYIFLPYMLLMLFVNIKFAIYHKIFLYEAVLLLIVLAFLCLVVFSVFISVNVGASALRASYVFLASLIFLLYFIKKDKRSFVFNLLNCSFLLLVFLSFYFIVNFTFSIIENGWATTISERYVGGTMSLPWGASNIISIALTACLGILCIAEILYDRRVRSITFVIYLTAVFLTFSRTGLMIGSMVVFYTLLSRLSLVRGLFFFSFFVIIFPVLVAFIFTYFSSVSLFSNRYSLENIGGMNGRLELWRDYLFKFIDEPFNFHGFYSALSYSEHTPHNIILSIAFDLGVIGVLLFSSMLLLLFYLVLRVASKFYYKKNITKAVGVIFIPMLCFFNFMFEDGIYIPQTWYVFYVYILVFTFYFRKDEQAYNVNLSY